MLSFFGVLLLNWMCNELSEGSAACTGVMGREEGRGGERAPRKWCCSPKPMDHFVVMLTDEEHFL